MNKKETAKILAILKAAYPNVKIDNAEAMVAAWEMVLGSFSADAVLKAARLHLETNKWFPAPSEIREKIVRAEIVYSPIEKETELLLLPESKETMTPERLEYIKQFLGFPDETDKTDNSPIDSKHWLE